MKLTYRLAGGPLLQQIRANRDVMIPIAMKIRVVSKNPIVVDQFKWNWEDGGDGGGGDGKKRRRSTVIVVVMVDFDFF